jgi:DNA-binding NtrC family response regulator
MYPEMSIIVVTGAGDIPLAVEAMRRGADNFLTKPVDMENLEVFLRKSLEIAGIRRRDMAEKRALKGEEFFFGESPVARELREMVLLAAENDSPVLLTGETGTGKGMLARWIHNRCRRGPQPFIEINCSGLRGEMLANELFGHVRGAYTTAVKDRQGLIEVAHRGTLFLDEIGDMDVDLQAQFLKVIEERSFRRLGDTALRQSDFRLICATNKELDREIEGGRFRRDLFFRIHVFPVQVPALRERIEDLPGLIRHLLEALGAQDADVSREAMKLLCGYSWPGNIRELRNVLERGVILARRGEIRPEHLPGLGGASETAAAPSAMTTPWSREEMRILSALDGHQGDVERAARDLGISRATFYRRLKKIRQKSR